VKRQSNAKGAHHAGTERGDSFPRCERKHEIKRRKGGFGGQPKKEAKNDNDLSGDGNNWGLGWRWHVTKSRTQPAAYEDEEGEINPPGMGVEHAGVTNAEARREKEDSLVRGVTAKGSEGGS